MKLALALCSIMQNHEPRVSQRWAVMASLWVKMIILVYDALKPKLQETRESSGELSINNLRDNISTCCWQTIMDLTMHVWHEEKITRIADNTGGGGRICIPVCRARWRGLLLAADLIRRFGLAVGRDSIEFIVCWAYQYNHTPEWSVTQHNTNSRLLENNCHHCVTYEAIS